MFCGQCGNKMADGARFCTQCGWKVAEEASSEVVANTSNAPEKKAQEKVAEDKPKKKSKLWLWILIIVLVLGLGTTATVLFFNNAESVEDDDDEDKGSDDEDKDSKDEDEEEDGESDDEDSVSGYAEYVDESEKVATVQMIASTMDVLEILAVDPMITWEIGEVVYVKFTEDGIEYGTDNEDIISNMKMILGDNINIKNWYGFEIWAKKDENGWIEFATSWTYDEMAEISLEFAHRFDITSVEP